MDASSTDGGVQGALGPGAAEVGCGRQCGVELGTGGGCVYFWGRCQWESEWRQRRLDTIDGRDGLRRQTSRPTTGEPPGEVCPRLWSSGLRRRGAGVSTE